VTGSGHIFALPGDSLCRTGHRPGLGGARRRAAAFWCAPSTNP